jgi:hypothetical protein
MPSVVNVVIERSRAARWLAAVVLVAVAACGGGNADVGGVDARVPPDAPPPCVPPAPGTAPTYTELYTKYFAPNTPGHCATAGCHLTAGNVWTCGRTKDSCYQGMVGIQLINTRTPTASIIADPRSSPLSWVNPRGPMPEDMPGSFPEGRDAIQAWVAACAQNN